MNSKKQTGEHQLKVHPLAAGAFLFLLVNMPFSGVPAAFADSDKQAAPAGEQALAKSDPYAAEAVKRYNKGHELVATGFYNQAINEFRAAIAADERIEPAWSNLGAVYARQKNYPKALESYQKALALKPNSPQSLNGLASVFLARGKSEQAIQIWRQALSYDAKFASAHFNIGCALENEHKDKQAVDEYYQAIDTNPDMGEPYYRIAAIYLKQQHPAQARAMFAKALALGPDAEYMRDAKKQLASLDASLSSDSAARYNKSK